LGRPVGSIGPEITKYWGFKVRFRLWANFQRERRTGRLPKEAAVLAKSAIVLFFSIFTISFSGGK